MARAHSRFLTLTCAVLGAAAANWVALGAALAADLDAPEDSASHRQRTSYEAAGFPLLAGDSDIGFEFGAVGTLSRFGNGVVPYQWNMDLVLALSVKNGPSGREIAQQSYQWNIDVPGLADGRVRLNPQLRYYRTVNQLYFGIGNASSGQRPAAASARYFEFDDRQASVRELTRVVLRGPFDLMVATTYRYEDPHLTLAAASRQTPSRARLAVHDL